ncbi:MAG: ABC-F family ATP-binding cassette domain-containing protein [Phycisphaerae bacterium]
MSLIVGQQVSKLYGAEPVLENVRFTLAPDDRVGLVGPNGQGKSTLLRILCEDLVATSGDIQRRKGLRIGYLPQDPPAALSDRSLHDCCLDAFAELQDVEQELAELADALSDRAEDESLLNRYGQLQTKFETEGGYDYHTRIHNTLTGLGFSPEQFAQPMAELSGGQRTRALLAQLLLEEPEVLLLDEPTNHLDLDAVEWLERYLAEFRGSLVVVSHDRYFLNRVTNRTWEVAFASLECYKGNYSAYVRQREERFAERMKQYEAQQEYVARTEEFIRRNLAGQRTKEAQGRRTKLERFLKLNAIPKPQRPAEIHLTLTPRRPSGQVVLNSSELTIGYEQDNPLATCEDIRVLRGQRIAIVGGNGVGKTTLLKTLLGRLDSLDGDMKFGTNVDVGYLSQAHDELQPHDTVLHAVQKATGCNRDEVRDALGAMLFSGDDALKKISELSGGQRSRVILAELALMRGNLLMLDEPTNHLDLPSRETLQETLDEFDGTIVFVSHDRYLVQAVASHIWAIEGGLLHVLHGGWEKYLQWRSERAERRIAAEAEAAGADAKQAVQERRERHENYEQTKKRKREMERMQRRHDELEEQIVQLEEDLDTLNEKVSEASEAGDVGAVERIGKEYQQKQTRLHELMEEWEQLGEQLEATPG